MMWWMFGRHVFWWPLLGGGLMMLLFWGGLALLGVLIWRAARNQPVERREGNTALDLLNARYARGEITTAEYQEMRRNILS